MNRLPCATIGCSLLPDLALGVEAVVVRLIIGTMVGTQIRNKANGIETDLIKIQDQMRIKEQGSTQISGVQSSAQHGPRALFRFQGSTVCVSCLSFKERFGVLYLHILLFRVLNPVLL